MGKINRQTFLLPIETAEGLAINPSSAIDIPPYHRFTPDPDCLTYCGRTGIVTSGLLSAEAPAEPIETTAVLAVDEAGLVVRALDSLIGHKPRRSSVTVLWV
jgi:hypothetical protein